MATYLSGVQALARECGLPSSPSTVVNQSGEFDRLVNWYKDAYIEIQNEDLWRWMRHEFTLNTVADQETYVYSDCVDSTDSAAISRFKSWRFKEVYDPPRIYLQSAGSGTETPMQWLNWGDFKTIYRYGNQPSGFPVHITVDPQDKIRIGPTPNGHYVITGEYYRSAQELSAGSDAPEMPSHFHNLILYAAMKKYGYFESADEVVARANMSYEKLKNQLVYEQGPTWQLEGSMI